MQTSLVEAFRQKCLISVVDSKTFKLGTAVATYLPSATCHGDRRLGKGGWGDASF
jgi:hypothetical protein